MPANAQIVEKSLGSVNSVDAQPFSLKATKYALVLIFGVATLIYVLQVFTPLRLTTDGITYLSFADSAARGNGFASIREGHIGYPKDQATVFTAPGKAL